MQVNVRGNPQRPGDEVPAKFPSGPISARCAAVSKGSGRLELADAIASSPLAARVIVNRVWKWHFGTGIVDTPSNFGQMGERPSNPELLEYLAKNFVDSGMSMKKLHREILLVFGVSVRRGHHRAQHGKGSRPTACIGARTASAWRRKRFVIRLCSSPARSI